MPIINGAREKEKALKEVESLLKSIKKVNSFVQCNYTGEEFQVSFFVPSDDYGITTETNILCENKHILDEMALAYKGRLVAEIKNLMAIYGIILTDEELKIVK